MIRKAAAQDLQAVSDIYEALHTQEENGRAVIGWARGIYPTMDTARAALDRGDLFVETDEDRVVGAAIINQSQVDCYADGNWAYEAKPEDVMVLHTLVIDPNAGKKGYGKAFVAFYESYAREQGCHYLRMDTNARNKRARSMYAGLGYSEPDIVPTVFNGIPGVDLVLLEKKLD